MDGGVEQIFKDDVTVYSTLPFHFVPIRMSTKANKMSTIYGEIHIWNGNTPFPAAEFLNIQFR